MSDQRCKCSMTISLLGDGCRYCQPQEYIDRLHDQIDEERKEANAADGQDALDAKRYRYLRNTTEFTDDVWLALEDMLGLDEAIDAAITAKEKQ